VSTRQPFVPDVRELVGLFYERPGRLGRLVEIESSAMPPVYRRMLDHNRHMTVTVESYYEDQVDVHVLETRVSEPHYARKILLRTHTDGRVVQFGIVRLNFSFLSDPVRQAIEAQRTPLGRILIEHRVLRKVQLVSLCEVHPGVDLCRHLTIDASQLTYGRTAMIYCNGEPAVELLEIVAPIS
jgi:chorismate-pyruvate lyase